MDKKEKLKQIVQEISTGPEEEAMWNSAINEASDDFAESATEILERFPEELSWFTAIFKRKQVAFALLSEDPQKAQELLAKIYQEERAKLEKLLADPS